MNNDEESEEDTDALFTQRHAEARDRVIKILDDTFDSYCVVYKVLSDDTKQDQIRVAYNNGRAEAVGLLEFGKITILSP